MKTTIRLDAAIKKLYIAFHKNTLNPECCKQCAVGNILDNTENWKYFSNNHGSLNLNYVGKVNQTLGKKFNGYTPQELLTIEHIFLTSCGYKLPLHHKNKRPKNLKSKSLLFEGLSAVIEYLCELDQEKNVMNYKQIFKYSTPEIQIKHKTNENNAIYTNQ